MYGLNYYDFWFQRFGNVNIDTWDLNGNSKENTQMPRYSLDFIIIGDLIKAAGTDPMLVGLKNLAMPGGIFDAGLSSVNSVLASIEPVTQWVGAGVASMQAVGQTINSAKVLVNGISNNGAQRTYANLTSTLF